MVWLLYGRERQTRKKETHQEKSLESLEKKFSNQEKGKPPQRERQRYKNARIKVERQPSRSRIRSNNPFLADLAQNARKRAKQKRKTQLKEFKRQKQETFIQTPPKKAFGQRHFAARIVIFGRQSRGQNFSMTFSRKKWFQNFNSLFFSFFKLSNPHGVPHTIVKRCG